MLIPASRSWKSPRTGDPIVEARRGTGAVHLGKFGMPSALVADLIPRSAWVADPAAGPTDSHPAMGQEERRGVVILGAPHFRRSIRSRLESEDGDAGGTEIEFLPAGILTVGRDVAVGAPGSTPP